MGKRLTAHGKTTQAVMSVACEDLKTAPPTAWLQRQYALLASSSSDSSEDKQKKKKKAKKEKKKEKKLQKKEQKKLKKQQKTGNDEAALQAKPASPEREELLPRKRPEPSRSRSPKKS